MSTFNPGSSFRPGRLRHRVDYQEPLRTDLGAGYHERDWATRATGIPAFVAPASGSETEEVAGQLDHERTFTVTLRMPRGADLSTPPDFYPTPKGRFLFRDEGFQFDGPNYSPNDPPTARALYISRIEEQSAYRDYMVAECYTDPTGYKLPHTSP